METTGNGTVRQSGTAKPEVKTEMTTERLTPHTNFCPKITASNCAHTNFCPKILAQKLGTAPASGR